MGSSLTSTSSLGFPGGSLGIHKLLLMVYLVLNAFIYEILFYLSIHKLLLMVYLVLNAFIYEIIFYFSINKLLLMMCILVQISWSELFVFCNPL